MQQKWRAPACYVGVAVICALYLLIVPGVLLTDVAAGAGIGAALMWAINEWETGKWKVVAVAQPALAAAAVPVATTSVAEVQAVLNQAAPMQAAPATAQTVSQVTVTQATIVEEAPARVDSGAATPATMEKWEIDQKEPSWDPSALAETWAKLRRELSINGSARPPVAPDLPRTAQLAEGPLFNKTQTAAAKPVAQPQPVVKPPLLAQQARLAAAHPKTTSSYSPMASQQLAAGTLRKTATGTQEPQRTAQAQPSFMRPSTSRPR